VFRWIGTGLFFLALSAVALALPAGSGAGRTVAAKSVSITAAMTPQQVVTPTSKPWRVPAGVRNAKGTFSGTLSPDGRTLTWHVSYTGIGKTTAAITDIHFGKPGKFGPILIRVCGPCTSGRSGVAKLKVGTANQFTTGNSWVTVITTTYPNGVVRGQIRKR